MDLIFYTDITVQAPEALKPHFLLLGQQSKYHRNVIFKELLMTSEFSSIFIIYYV